MRDSATGRSRGFGFLTFKDPKTVNTVMVKEHFLDGKIVRSSLFDISPGGQKRLGTFSSSRRTAYWLNQNLLYGSQIDPKRAIPRDEQEKTAKIFVGGVSQEATEEDFEGFFAHFGRVVDATLMMDKDTGRPRGFGFVTFDSDAAVERCLENQPLEILGKQIEVKRAQPRGKMGEEDDFSRGGRGRGKFGGRDDRFGSNDNSQSTQSGQNQGQNMAGGMTPQMMAQYWQRMQQYFSMMQQSMASNMMGGMGMNQMNPQMMAQMQMQQQMQKMQGGNSPNPQNGGNMGMTPQMMQQMMQMQQQQGAMNGMNMGNGRGGMGQNNNGNNRGSFSAQEQMAFEQQKYEQQQGGRRQGNFPTGPRGGGFQNQNPQSWEGMYDDVPQPDGRGSAGPVRNNTPKPPKGPSGGNQAAPANAPTGPKNAGKPAPSFRGGRGRFHPYGR